MDECPDLKKVGKSTLIFRKNLINEALMTPGYFLVPNLVTSSDSPSGNILKVLGPPGHYARFVYNSDLVSSAEFHVINQIIRKSSS